MKRLFFTNQNKITYKSEQEHMYSDLIVLCSDYVNACKIVKANSILQQWKVCL